VAVTAAVWHVALRWFLGVRFLIAVIAVGQGYFRLTQPDATASLSYGTSQVFGVLLVACGLLAVATLRWRLRLVGRAGAAALGALYGMLCTAVWCAPASAVTSFSFAVAMLAEAGAYD